MLYSDDCNSLRRGNTHRGYHLPLVVVVVVVVIVVYHGWHTPTNALTHTCTNTHIYNNIYYNNIQSSKDHGSISQSPFSLFQSISTFAFWRWSHGGISSPLFGCLGGTNLQRMKGKLPVGFGYGLVNGTVSTHQTFRSGERLGNDDHLEVTFVLLASVGCILNLQVCNRGKRVGQSFFNEGLTGSTDKSGGGAITHSLKQQRPGWQGGSVVRCYCGECLPHSLCGERNVPKRND